MPTKTFDDLVVGRKVKQVGKEAVSTFSSSTKLFPSPPDKASYAVVTIRTQGLTVMFDGTDPTASAIGNDYPPGTYIFDLSREDMKLTKAIEMAASATAYITYWGLR